MSQGGCGPGGLQKVRKGHHIIRGTRQGGRAFVREIMQASYLGAMGYAQRYNFPTTWPIPPSYHDPATSVRSYQEGMAECERAEEMGFAWVSF